MHIYYRFKFWFLSLHPVKEFVWWFRRNHANQVVYRLNGRQLTRVEKIVDYFQLHFEEISLTVITDMHLFACGDEFIQPSPEFDITLESLEGHRVSEIQFHDSEYLKLFFEDNVMLLVSLRREDCGSNPEAMVYKENEGWNVWNY